MLRRDPYNGQPQEITVFDNVVCPVSVAVMLDTSISMTNRLEDGCRG